ncbi:TRAP-type mannitol/chloroaromatic compound transport system permease small subunit [Breoghania corrubedonensis]|uniref:TRAP transporter small permease protein n=1 Tax=Breoghania corrubedonensis TaxID=665038 RepID=A0A2T5UYN9_9HYPH|nr:TRAP transporter small permease subunit [Breoghania corrubedonensis]PTW56626.1 TRAP-type mannitol/chloroaromatic compound transport system permease small subunit [Breoghania corrubedonensis]
MARKTLILLRRLNRIIAILVGLMFLVCAGTVLLDIVLRKLGASFGGTDEITGYVMAIASAWGMGFAMLELAHVRIDVLRAQVNQLGRSIFDLLSMLVLSGTITVIAMGCWPVVARSIANGSHANTPLETPLALVQVPWLAGWIWFACMAWATFVAAFVLVLQGRFEESEFAIGAFAEQEAMP